METFRKESGTDKALHLTMITLKGLAETSRRGVVISEIRGEDLLRELPGLPLF